ncbi:MAG: hypothetical protein HFJ19_05240 [Clostridia bacterium]|nr:hypothetical protein [Clostridia bacterium]
MTIKNKNVKYSKDNPSITYTHKIIYIEILMNIRKIHKIKCTKENKIQETNI